MNIRKKTLLAASSLLMLCNIAGLGQANAVEITPGESYNNRIDEAGSSVWGIKAGVYYARKGEVEITNNTFTNNTSTGNEQTTMGLSPGGGGAVYDWAGKVTIDNSTFSQNSSTGTGLFDGGGAVVLYETTEFNIRNRSIFNNNRAAHNGGAIFFAGAQNGTIDNADFIGNTADSAGGALYFNNKTKDIFITNSLFKGNKAGDKETYNTYGGAIAINGLQNSSVNADKYTISDSRFEENESSAGGALYISGELKFNNLTFDNNSAEEGGAAYIISGSGRLGTYTQFDNSHFTNNSAEGNGGAIYGWGDFQVNNSDFSNNHANQGGAIYIANDGPNIISDTTFKNNTANLLGGAITLNEGNLQLNDCRFEGNNAGTRGGAISFSATSNNTTESYPLKNLFIHNTDFIDNICEQESGGAIYINVDRNIKGMHEVRIVSNDGTTHEFSGNVHTDYANRQKANAIFINQGDVTLRTANEGSKLLFNDGIEGANIDNATVAVNGDVTVNAQIKKLTLSLNGGNLDLNMDNTRSSLTEGMPVLENVDLNLNSGTLNLQNGKLDVLNIRNLNIGTKDDIKIAIDADLSKGESDIFNISGEMSGEIKFDAEHFDVNIKNGSKDSFQLLNVAGSEISVDEDSEIVEYTADIKYVLSLKNDGYVEVEKHGTSGISAAVEGDGIREYRQNPAQDLTLNNDLGSMGGEYLKINMDSQDLDGAKHQGLIVSEGQRLELKNIGSVQNNKAMHNFVTEGSGAVVDNAGTLSVNNSIFKNNTANVNGGAINNTGETTIVDSSFIDNSSNENGGAIFNQGGKVTISAETKDVLFTGNKANGKPNDITMVNNIAVPVLLSEDVTTTPSDTGIAQLTIKGSKTTSLMDGINGEGIISKEGTGTFNLGGDNSGYVGDVAYLGGVTNLVSGAKYFSAENTTFNNNAMLNLANNNPNDKVNFGNLNLEGNGRIGLDVATSGASDKISALSASGDGKLVIDNINFISNSINANVTNMAFDILEKNADGTNPLLGKIELNTNNKNYALGPIYKYQAGFDPESGQLLLTGGAGKTSNNYNPAVLSAPIGALVGSYLSQLNSYDMAFTNMDMYMLMPLETRNALKLRNKYAISNYGIYSPTNSYTEDRGVWFKPYSVFESVRPNNGSRISNVAYGSYFGGDTDLMELKHGFDGVFSVYASYNGSHQAFSGNSIYQNGGTLGAAGYLYKGNFFTGITANVGANVGDASTMYGSENFTTLTSGIAAKTGYNWELAKGKFIIQPSYTMSYSFVNNFDYKNAAGVRISSDPIHAMQLSPGIKFIGNLKNGWQPYVGMSIVWNILDDTKFKANGVKLPELSVDPYFSYGLGVQKTVGERFTGFFQSMFRAGSRNGAALTLGLRWSIGKDGNSQKVQNTNTQRAVVKQLPRQHKVVSSRPTTIQTANNFILK